MTKKMELFNQRNTKAIHSRIEDFLYKLGMEYGVTMRLDNIERGNYVANAKIDMYMGFNEEVEAKRQWDKYCIKAGYRKTLWGKEVVVEHIRYVIWAIPNVTDPDYVMAHEANQMNSSVLFSISNEHIKAEYKTK